MTLAINSPRQPRLMRAVLRIARSRDVWAVIFLAAVTLTFFWPLLLAGKFIPRGGGDLVSFLWPQYSFAAQSLRAGTIPLWNPYLYSGMPFLADNQTGVLYPINLLAFALFPDFNYGVMEGLVVFHIWLAGAAMYVALRLWPTDRPVDRLPAVLGAVAYMFSDVFVTHIGNLNLIAVAAWLPLIFGLFARGLHDRRLSFSVGASLAFATAILAGHAQMTAITSIGLGAIALWQFISAATWRSCSQVIGLAALMLLVVFGLTAMQLLPSLEMTHYSLRADLSYEEATAYSLPPTALASIFSPLLFGRGAIDFWGPWQRVETGYLGCVPLLLLGLAFTRKRSNSAWFLAALGLLGLLIALGKYMPIYSLVHALPVLGGLRVPARFILLTDFAVAALAAMGMQRLLTERISLRRILGWAVIILAVGAISLVAAYQAVAIGGHAGNLFSALIGFVLFAVVAVLIMWRQTRSKTLAPHASAGVQNPKSKILLVALAAIELIALGSTIEVDTNNPTLGYDHPAIVNYLRSDPNAFRIENTSGAWQPDAALMRGLNDTGGIFNPLGLAAYETYRGGMGNRGSPLYNFLGVKYVLAPKDQPAGDASFVPVFNADPSIDVYLNTKALPRAQLIDRVKVVATGEEAWAAIHAPGFDPAAMVVVEGGPTLSVAGGSGQRSLSFAQQSIDRVELDVQTPSPTYLVLSDVYYPGWSATLDDRPTPIYAADFAFRAVWVPAGLHHIRFQFEPSVWQWGAVISGAMLLGLLGAFGLAWRKKVALR